MKFPKKKDKRHYHQSRIYGRTKADISLDETSNSALSAVLISTDKQAESVLHFSLLPRASLWLYLILSRVTTREKRCDKPTSYRDSLPRTDGGCAASRTLRWAKVVPGMLDHRRRGTPIRTSSYTHRKRPPAQVCVPSCSWTMDRYVTHVNRIILARLVSSCSLQPLWRVPSSVRVTLLLWMLREVIPSWTRQSCIGSISR